MTAEIDLLARQHAPQVLAEALRAARSKAVEVLTEQLASAMLAEAVKPYRPPAVESADAERGLCVYAITREHDLAVPALRAASEPRLIAHDGLGAVVADVELSQFSDLDSEPVEDSALARLAREHDAVVRAVFEREPVLPLRFGTVVTDERAARELLVSQHDQASRWLDRVEGHREWGVRVESCAPPGTTGTTVASTDGLSGTEYLRRKQNVLSRDRDRAKAAKSLHSKLTMHATDTACREQRPRTLLDAAYLVPQDNELTFRDAVTRLAEPLEQLGATVHTTGPWPPYSFTRIELAVQR